MLALKLDISFWNFHHAVFACFLHLLKLLIEIEIGPISHANIGSHGCRKI